MIARLGRALSRAIRVLIWPGRGAAQRGPVVLQVYRGYGSRRRILLAGRVYRQPGIGPPSRAAVRSLFGRIVDLGRWLLRWGLAEHAVRARFYGQEQVVATDGDGYFLVDMTLATPPPDDRQWHEIALLLRAPTQLEAHGEIFIPPAGCRHVVISDIDDTVMATGVANKMEMMWRLFMQRAASRVAFPGVASLLTALHNGPDGTDANPMLYVSRAPWSIYEVLEVFFRLHHIPGGPILFLREWGLTFQNPLPRRAESHKLDVIRTMLRVYDELPFILIGDSGQHDPEIYLQVVRDHPGQVAAIYIRNIGHSDSARTREIEALAREVAAAGSGLVLAADSAAMAEHAAQQGFISAADAARVAADTGVPGTHADEAAPGPPRTPAPTRRLRPEELQAALAGLARDGKSSIVVEARNRKRRRWR